MLQISIRKICAIRVNPRFRRATMAIAKILEHGQITIPTHAPLGWQKNLNALHSL